MIHGRAYITANGVRYNTLNGASLKLSGTAGTPVVGDSGFAGMQEAFEAGEVTCTIIAADNVSSETLMALKDTAVTFDSDNGKSWISSNASRGPLPKLGKDGWEMTFFGEFKEA